MIRFICLSFVLVLVGCGGGVDPKAPKVEPVSGVVTLDGKPIKNADLTFIPTDGQTESFGRTDDEGKYTLSIRNHKGAVAGTHKVTISRRVREDGSDFPDDRENMGAGKESIPEKYVDRGLTELTAKVDLGENEINFDLKSK